MSRSQDSAEAADEGEPRDLALEKAREKERARELDARITGWLQVGIPTATLVGSIVGGLMQGPPAVVLALATGALVTVIAIFWSSVRTLAGETALSGADAYALGAPKAEEEQKRAVLRALKDLEFERSVGKISEEDYAVLVARYRAEAKRLLRLLDNAAAPERVQIEAMVKRRLRREGLIDADPGGFRGPGTDQPPLAPAASDDELDDEEEELDEPVRAAPAPKPVAKVEKVEALPKNRKLKRRPRPPLSANACPKCETSNDPDAAFCKKCGAKLETSADEEGAS